jgi:hypothetical protein
MSAPFDESEFIDRDFTSSQPATATMTPLAPPSVPMNPQSQPPAGRPPTREELESHLTLKQQQLAELRQKQEAIERERVALEESRRRQAEFDTGRPEMIHQLTRGVELLEKAEFNARREAEQMAKSLTGLREALANVQAIQKDGWTPESWQTELTRALTTIENARMEWNGARLKWTVLNGESGTSTADSAAGGAPFGQQLFAGRSLRELCRVGLALTWPLATVALLALIALTVVLLKR